MSSAKFLTVCDKGFNVYNDCYHSMIAYDSMILKITRALACGPKG